MIVTGTFFNSNLQSNYQTRTRQKRACRRSQSERVNPRFQVFLDTISAGNISSNSWTIVDLAFISWKLVESSCSMSGRSFDVKITARSAIKGSRVSNNTTNQFNISWFLPKYFPPSLCELLKVRRMLTSIFSWAAHKITGISAPNSKSGICTKIVSLKILI